jgi:predicted lipid carrier protein YhbT
MDLDVTDQTRIPVFPLPMARALGAIPLPVFRRLLEPVIGTVARRHPSLFDRLGDHAAMTFLIDPTDLPFAFRLRPRRGAPRIEVIRRPAGKSWDARIAGPLAALLGMVHGALDGDALFFSRDLAIEGNTEAILALRNAIDDAEIDLLTEAAATLGPLAPILDRPARVMLPILERLTGVALTRAGRRSA